MEPNLFVIDSCVFIAAFYQEDSKHREAIQIFSDLQLKSFIVHPYVIQETATVLTYKLGPYAAFLFIQTITKAANATITSVDIGTEMNYFISLKKKVSFTDSTLINLAKTLNAGLVTFDKQMLALFKK